jgi:hypothetical protein
LVRLESKSGRLSGAVGSEGRPLELSVRRDADDLLEAALSRLMEEVGRIDADDSDTRESPSEGRGGKAPEAVALLSQEEIEAFRD